LGTQTAQTLVKEGKQADLLIANNVLAHTPDINDFVAGLKILLKPKGIFTIEFPHILQLIKHNQFDTIYHEHFSYLSFKTVEQIFAKHGLKLFDVEELSTHGGSLRIYGQHDNLEKTEISTRITALKEKELQAKLDHIETYLTFGEQVKVTKRQLLHFLIEAKNNGKTIVGYGAPAKGNTLLNYCGLRTDFIDYTVDRNPHKQGLYLPGTHIPIYHPDTIHQTRPDYVLILPWNIKNEIVEQMNAIREWGGQFVVPIPQVEVI
jgi:sulfur relay (sulfurtransferase) DsrF/TusC family protein